MPIYGYPGLVVDDGFGLLELREITLDLQPADLRRLARFLEHYAAEIESGVLRTGHVHLTTYDPGWRRDHPGVDVILANPDPEPPGRNNGWTSRSRHRGLLWRCVATRAEPTPGGLVHE